MLKDKLFILKGLKTLQATGESGDVSEYHAEVRLDSAHGIFLGHFPGNPIFPGVCQIDMVREVLEEITGTGLFLKESTQVKFLRMVKPLEDQVLFLNIRIRKCPENELDVTAEISETSSAVMKLKGKYKINGHA
jgi:3-hydroxyacyl-[acyl-carrier-protein] dehydratase